MNNTSASNAVGTMVQRCMGVWGLSDGDAMVVDQPERVVWWRSSISGDDRSEVQGCCPAITIARPAAFSMDTMMS